MKSAKLFFMKNLKSLLALSLLVFSGVSTAQSSQEIPKDSQGKPCRCGDGNGACELKPELDPKNPSFDKIKVTKSAEQAYTLTESSRLKKEDVAFEYAQGGCDHTFYSFSFQSKDSLKIADRAAILQRLATLLELTKTHEGTSISATIKKGIQRIGELPKVINKSGDKELPPYHCEAHEENKAKFNCMFTMEPNFSYLEIEADKGKDGKTQMKVTEIIAL
jgi:hypothetical protein